MPRFAYTARDQAGQTQRASLEAPARRDAMRILAARGLQVVDLREATAAGGRAVETAAAPERIVAATRFSTRERLPFLQALVDLIASGMPAGEAVRLLGVRIKEPGLRGVCGKLWERLGEGLPLSRALATLPEVFDTQTVNLIAAGEATGNLKEVLLRLIQHFTEQK
jgi:general secretion pathway protein F